MSINPSDVFSKLNDDTSSSNGNTWVEYHNNGKFGFFINGQWEYPENGEYYASNSPSTSLKVAELYNTSEENINMIIESANSAYTTWSTLSPVKRAMHLTKLAHTLKKYSHIFSALETIDNELNMNDDEDKCNVISNAVNHFEYYAGWAQLKDEEFPTHDPVSVVSIILPWNASILQLATKVAPALAMGNTVIISPTSYTRLTTLLFLDICVEAGLPHGVVNIITDSDPFNKSINTIINHKLISQIDYQGTSKLGKDIQKKLVGSGKRFSALYDGNSTTIVYNTTNIEDCISNITKNNNNTESVRCLVQENIYYNFVEKLQKTVEALSPVTIPSTQTEVLKGICEKAKQSGCDIFPLSTSNTNTKFPLTVISGIQQTADIITEGVAGPIITVQSFRTMEEAINLVNNSKYGSQSNIYTDNINLAFETAHKLKVGNVYINTHSVTDASVGIGGYKESSVGRTGGKEALLQYLISKTEKSLLNKDILQHQTKWTSPPANTIPSYTAPSSSLKSPFSNRVDKTWKMYIGGKQRRPDGEYSHSIVSPSGVHFGLSPEGSRKDLRDAVAAAVNSVGGGNSGQVGSGNWGKLTAHSRAQIMYFIAENLYARAEEFILTLHSLTERSMEDCSREVELCIDRLFYYAAFCDKMGGAVKETTQNGLIYSVNEALGVVGIVCPDQYPLLAFISLIGPALCRGNSVVVIPSQKYPLPALDLYQIFDTSDVPAGTINIVSGDSDSLVKTLVEHKEINAVWYCGNIETCNNVISTGIESVKNIWTNHSEIDWTSCEGFGKQFVERSVEVKNIYIPFGSRDVVLTPISESENEGENESN